MTFSVMHSSVNKIAVFPQQKLHLCTKSITKTTSLDKYINHLSILWPLDWQAPDQSVWSFSVCRRRYSPEQFMNTT